jgi:putative membrane protein
MKTMMLATVCAVAMTMAACGPKTETAATPPSEQAADAMTPVEAPMDPAAKTLDFATKAANADMIEIGASKAAAGKTKNAEVKKLANMLVTDHTKTSTELKAWAGKTTVALPAGLSGMDQGKVDNIANADANGFDDKYLDTVIDVHEGAINAFNDYIQNGQEADLKAWATATLPKLQAHLDAAKTLRDKINKT